MNTLPSLANFLAFGVLDGSTNSIWSFTNENLVDESVKDNQEKIYMNCVFFDE